MKEVETRMDDLQFSSSKTWKVGWKIDFNLWNDDVSKWEVYVYKFSPSANTYVVDETSKRTFKPKINEITMAGGQSRRTVVWVLSTTDDENEGWASRNSNIRSVEYEFDLSGDWSSSSGAQSSDSAWWEEGEPSREERLEQAL